MVQQDYPAPAWSVECDQALSELIYSVSLVARMERVTNYEGWEVNALSILRDRAGDLIASLHDAAVARGHHSLLTSDGDIANWDPDDVGQSEDCDMDFGDPELDYDYGDDGEWDQGEEFYADPENDVFVDGSGYMECPCQPALQAPCDCFPA